MSVPRFDSIRQGSLKRRQMITDLPGECWDVQFYPYLVQRDDPLIFAVICYHDVLIYMIDGNDDGGMSLLAAHQTNKRQRTGTYVLNSCTWCYVDANEPLLAVTGESGQILIIEPMTGRLFASLVSHGQGVINALTTHPKYPWIIASASLDTSIRIWDLRRLSDPTLSTSVVICGHSMAHKECLLTIDWHHSGRYIVSGGFDYRVAVWSLPDLDPESDFWYKISKEGRERSRDEVHVIYWPHFLSSSVHSDIIDTAKFVGDLIVSRASKESKLVLWSVTGLNEDREPPESTTAVKTLEHLETINGFVQRPGLYMDDDFFSSDAREYKGPELYRRLLQFSLPHSETYWLRFDICKPSTLFPEVRLTLSAGNHDSQVSHWDLQTYIDGQEKPQSDQIPSAKSRRVVGGASEFILREKYPLHDPERLLEPMLITRHHLPKMAQMVNRAIAWSPCGRWCIVVGGDNNSDSENKKGLIQLYERLHATQ